MEQRAKSIIFYFPKIAVFGLALLNFFYVYSQKPVRTNGTLSFPLYTPWYETSSAGSEILSIVAASIFLLIGKRWSYLIAAAISGYFVVYGLFYSVRTFFYIGFFEWWKHTKKTDPSIFLAEEVQWILAGIIFSVTLFYLVQNILRKDNSKEYL